MVIENSCVLFPRFQLRQYASIHIVQTEKKGFGLRAAENLRKCVLLVLSPCSGP